MFFCAALVILMIIIIMGENSLLAVHFEQKVYTLKKIVYMHTKLTKQSIEFKYSDLFH